MRDTDYIVTSEDLILVTGSNGFIGTRVVDTLLQYGFTRIRCFVRPSSDLTLLNKIIDANPHAKIELISGNLLSREDCIHSVQGVAVVFHLAAGIEKTFPGSFLNSVVTTRNLLEVIRDESDFKRFLNVSSFSVYSNRRLRRGALLDENCELENHLVERNEPYCYGKFKQEELVIDYGHRYNIPYVIVRPGAVYGPGKPGLTARIGIDTFGFFMHIGGRNLIPLTYVDNCAEAMVLAGIKKGVEGEIFNIVDDELPQSRDFLKLYKQNVDSFRSMRIPYPIFNLMSHSWEKYSQWSEGQLPPAFNRYRCAAYWKGNTYSNHKLKSLLGWYPKVTYEEACNRFFESARNVRRR